MSRVVERHPHGTADIRPVHYDGERHGPQPMGLLVRRGDTIHLHDGWDDADLASLADLLNRHGISLTFTRTVGPLHGATCDSLPIQASRCMTTCWEAP